MKLKALTLPDVEQVRQWRNDCLQALRTPFLLTAEMQENFYRDIICNRNARARYWGIWEEIETTSTECFLGEGEIVHFGSEKAVKLFKLIGMVGMENIEWENRLAEISIILNPEYQGKGYGEKAVDLLLDQGFNYLNLENIWGECYKCNPALSFWRKICGKYIGYTTILPKRKYWEGTYHDSLYFNINKSNFEGARE